MKAKSINQLHDQQLLTEEAKRCFARFCAFTDGVSFLQARDVSCTIACMSALTQSVALFDYEKAPLTATEITIWIEIAPSLLELYWIDAYGVACLNIPENKETAPVSQCVKFTEESLVTSNKRRRSLPSLNQIAHIIEARKLSFLNALIQKIKSSGEELLHFYSSGCDTKDPSDVVRSSDSSDDPAPSEDPEIINLLRNQKFYSNQMRLDSLMPSFELIPARKADYAPQPIEPFLSKPLCDYLSQNQIQLFVHQEQALSALLKSSSSNVILSTPTSSGKSLVYQFAILQSIWHHPSHRALLIFPTKALSYDQMRSFKKLASMIPQFAGVTFFAFDGDTPMGERNRILERGQVIFTNFDILHSTLLPKHSTWSIFLKNLHFIMIDELHYYAENAFGQHCMHILSRLGRLIAHHGGGKPRFITCSATLDNPADFMRTFCGIPAMDVVDIHKDGSACGELIRISWQPSPENESSGYRTMQAIHLLSFFIQRGIKTLCFTRTRHECESLTRELRRHLACHGASPDCAVSYRGGYLAADRRRLEKQLQEGLVTCVISTNALELGVDIGCLEAVVLLHRPTSDASLRQQLGRVGRRGKRAISVVIESQPAGNSVEDGADEKAPSGQLGLDMHILESHIQCAATELPIIVSNGTESEDLRHFGNPEMALTICKNALRFDSETSTFYASAKYRGKAHSASSLRCFQSARYRCINRQNGETIEEVEEARAPFELYEGGVFLHQGNAFIMSKVDAPLKQVIMLPLSRNDYLTKPLVQVTYQLSDAQSSLGGLYCGTVNIVHQATGYQHIHPLSRKVLDHVKLPSTHPSFSESSDGIWITFSPFKLSSCGDSGEHFSLLDLIIWLSAYIASELDAIFGVKLLPEPRSTIPLHEPRCLLRASTAGVIAMTNVVQMVNKILLDFYASLAGTSSAPNIEPDANRCGDKENGCDSSSSQRVESCINKAPSRKSIRLLLDASSVHFGKP